jgi:hypothetical protein
MVSELMEIESRFIDGEDAYNNERGVHYKATDQAGNVTKGVGLVTRMDAQGATK